MMRIYQSFGGSSGTDASEAWLRPDLIRAVRSTGRWLLARKGARSVRVEPDLVRGLSRSRPAGSPSVQTARRCHGRTCSPPEGSAPASRRPPKPCRCSLRPATCAASADGQTSLTRSETRVIAARSWARKTPLPVRMNHCSADMPSHLRGLPRLGNGASRERTEDERRSRQAQSFRERGHRKVGRRSESRGRGQARAERNQAGTGVSAEITEVRRETEVHPRGVASDARRTS